MRMGYGALYTCILVILMYGVHISVLQDPCHDRNVVELNDMAKRSPSYAMDSTPLCDRYITETWYKATDHVMTTSPPSLTYCGTLYPVWLNDVGPLPSNGLTKTLTACQVGFSDQCARPYDIKVKNCSSFLIYELKPLDACNSAYCFELPDVCINETVTSVRVSFHNVTWKTEAHPNIAGMIRHDPSINLLCSFTPSADDTLLYHIDWYVDNDIVIQGQTVDKDSLQDAILSAEDMLKAGKKMNSWIHCVVGIKKSRQKLPCASKSSKLFFAGLEILNQTLTIKRKGQESLMIRPTIPFASETLEINENQQDPSNLDIQLSFPGSTCEGRAKTCTVSINSYKHEDRHMYENSGNWKKIYKLELFNTDDENYYIQNNKLVLRLETNSPPGEGAKIFADVIFADVHINVVEDQEAWKGKRCSSYADPHQSTFDGLAYECQSSGCIIGWTYVFYRNENHLQEIQVRHGSCWGAPRCVCAVAARAGQDVFTIDACNEVPYFNFPICNENSLKVIKESDKTYKIIFPTGTFAKIMLHYHGFWLINLEVYPTVADVSRTSGLCGFLDNDKTNDFKRRDGTQDSIHSMPPDPFSLSWRLPTGSMEDLLAYSQSVYDQLTPLSSYFHKLCTCDEEQLRCSYKQYNQCKTKDRGKEYQCVLHSSSRRKRNSLHLTPIPEIHRASSDLSRIKRQIYNSIEAFNICNEAFQQSSYYGTCIQVVPNFSNETLVNCISDIVMTGDHNLTQLHLETALGQCKAYILLNSTLQSEHPDVTTLIMDLCPNNCSKRGLCSKGNCTCDSGYGGSDCSFDVTSPPTIRRLLGNGVCDKSTEICDDITLYGQYFVENMGTTCYVTRNELKESQSDTEISTSSYTVKLEERTLSEGYVNLRYGTDQSWITTFHFNMSNDDVRFSEFYTVYVYQSKCQTFNNISGEISFTLQTGYCYIDGKCFTSGASKNNDSCLQCKPNFNAFNWTDCSEEDTSSAMTKSSSLVSSTTSFLQPSSTTPKSLLTTTISTEPDGVTRFSKKTSTANDSLTMLHIGLITGIILVATLICVIVVYNIKTKLTIRKNDQLSILKNLDVKLGHPNKDATNATGKSNDLFHFDTHGDKFSRPPSASSLAERALGPTNDFSKVFPPQSHRSPSTVKPIHVWDAN
uniref:von Willebrand factor D and EGF domain-containing protein-like n=1 Tax=Crassostrea virginica TaxID=6565 RepID=A0A8B8C729_CRAVI|nr:von Willebrand factor D and EGF domain-containing protein-like [Crassostrea virginica]